MKQIFFNVYKFFLIPHLLLYVLSKQKEEINMDIDRWATIRGMHKKKYALLLHFLAYSPDFRTLFYFRIKSFAVHILNLYCRKHSSFTIDVTTKIKGGVLTGHPYCTILNANLIGENFYVNHLVTIGEVNGKRPTIGNNVSVNTGAIIIGDIFIGDNSVIGAGAVVVKSIPNNCVVVGNPARIIKKNGKRIKYTN